MSNGSEGRMDEKKRASEYRYAVTSRRIWNDSAFKALSASPPCGQSLFHRLLTAPEASPIPGLIPVGRAALAEALGWTLDGFDQAIGEAIAQGMVKADWNARLIWLPKAFKHNKPASTNQVRGWVRAFNEIPDSPLKDEARSALRELCVSLGKAWISAFNEERSAARKPKAKPSPKPSAEPSPMPKAKASPKPKAIQTPTPTPTPTLSGEGAQSGGGDPVRKSPETKWEASLRAATATEAGCLAAFDEGYATTSPGKRPLGVRGNHADALDQLRQAEGMGDPVSIFREAGAELGRRVSRSKGTEYAVLQPWRLFLGAPIGSWLTDVPRDAAATEIADRILALAADSRRLASLASDALKRGDKAERARLNAESERAAQECERLKREAVAA